MSAPSLSALDPTLLDSVRERLVDGFSLGIFDATPEISEFLEFQAAARKLPVGDRRFERAPQVLAENRRDLQNQLSICVRRNLDAKIVPFLDQSSTTARLSLDALTLMADERLDEEIAVNQCARRLKEQCEYELWGLTQRICVLLGRDSFADNDNPVFPQLFAKSLMEALAVLDLPPAARLAVFKAFGPVLLDIVPAVYRSANEYLTARGVDVDTATYYGPPVTRSGRAFAAQPTAQEIALGVANSNKELVTTLKNLLDHSSTRLQGQIHGTAETTSTEGSQLIAALKVPAMRLALGEAEGTPAGTRSRTLHLARQSLHDRLNADEQLVTDIVTVIFDRLLVESRIVPQLQPVIRRLQLPVLELVLRDRSLLTQVQHPVRKLIDLIAEFGLTLELTADDESTVLSVANIVDGLLQIRGEEPRAFQLAFERLDDLFYHHEEAALQRNEYVRELERSEARDFAGHLADREIALRLQNRMLPSTVTSFIVTVWREVLVNGYIKNGPKGEAWKLGLTTLDDLLKSLAPSTPQPERETLAASLPPLIALLQSAPHNTPQDPTARESFFAELDRLNALALAGDWAAVAGQRFVPSESALFAADLAVSPSAELATMGIACGDWIETRHVHDRRRWRLNWITSIRGSCVFKHYESNTTRSMSIDELRTSLASGETQRVRGLGLADDIINGAFEVVSRKARRNEVALPSTAGQGLPGGMTH